MEAEYVASAAAAQEAVWLRRFHKRLIGHRLKKQPVTLFTDSMSVLVLAKDSKYHYKSKHIQLRYHYIQSLRKRGKIDQVYIQTADMVADPLTKPLVRSSFQQNTRAMGFRRL